MDTNTFQTGIKEDFIGRIHRLPQHLRIRVVRLIDREITAAEDEAGLTTAQNGLPIVPKEVRDRALKSLREDYGDDIDDLSMDVIRKSRRSKDLDSYNFFD